MKAKTLKKNSIIISILLAIVIAVVCISRYIDFGHRTKAEDTGNTFVTYSGLAQQGYERSGTNLEFTEWLHNQTYLPSYCNDKPAITFLVHGQGSAASFWSNENGVHKLTYDKDSLIEVLRNRAGGADVYYAQSTFEYGELADEDLSEDDKYTYISYVDNDDKDKDKYPNCLENQNYRDINSSFNQDLEDGKQYNCNIATKRGFDLFELKIDDTGTKTSYVNIDKMSRGVLQVKDKHIIVVFGATNVAKSGHHYVLNNELHYIIDNLCYDYRAQTGRIPKINLVAHSRGGVSSLIHFAGYDYKNNGEQIYDHTYNVDRIFTFGSPLPSRKLLTEDSMPDIVDLAYKLGMGNLIDCNSARDMANAEVCKCIRDNWKNAVDNNPNIKLYAMGSDFRFSFLLKLAQESNYKSENESDFCDVVLAAEKQVLPIMEGICGALAAVSAVKIGDCLAAPPPFQGVIVTASLISFVANIVCLGEFLHTSSLVDKGLEAPDLETKKEYTLQSLEQLVEMEHSIEVVAEFLHLNSALSFVYEILGDMVINTDSQLGKYLYNPNGNIESFLKTYQVFEVDLSEGEERDRYVANFDVTKIATDNIEVPHNLEPRDVDMIANVARNISLGVPTTIYRTYGMPDGTVCVQEVELQNLEGGKVVQPFHLNFAYGILGRQVRGVFSDFSECKELTCVTFPCALERIEAGIFCETNLTYIDTVDYIVQSDLPRQYNFIAEDNILYCASDSDDGYYTKIVQAPITIKYIYLDNTVTEIGDYAFYGSALKNVGGGSGLVRIGKYAFTDTEFFNNTNGLVTVGVFVIGYNGEKTELTARDLGAASFIADGAFARDNGANSVTRIELGDSILSIGEGAFMYNDNLTSVDLSRTRVTSLQPQTFLGCTKLTSVSLPDSLQVIMSEAFTGCWSLPKITLGKNVEAIGSNAFSGGRALTEVNVLSFYPPSLGQDAFLSCSNKLVINIPWTAREYYTNAINWIEHKERFSSRSFAVDFDTSGGESCGSLNVLYYQVLSDLPTPTRSGYTFVGWKDGDGKAYRRSDSWDVFGNGTLYAEWEANLYSIFYYNVDGLINGNPEAYTAENTINLCSVKKPHNKFVGWYDNAEFNGDIVEEIPQGSVGTIRLYARYLPDEVSVTDSNGNNIADGADSVYYGLDYKLIVPQSDSYVFDGWYYGDRRLTDKNGYSISKWSIDLGSVVLTEKWHSESYVVTVNSNGQTMFVDSDGLKTELTSVLYGGRFTSSDDLVEQFKAFGLSHIEGFVFKGLFDGQARAILWGDSVPDLGNDSDGYAVFPMWDRETYTIHIGNNVRFNVSYDDKIVYPASVDKRGYSIERWIIKAVENCDTSLFRVGEEFDFARMPDLNPDVEGSAKITLEPVYTANQYYITFDSGSGASYCGDICAVYDSTVTAKVPSRVGYTFGGWYDGSPNNLIFDSTGSLTDSSKKWTIAEDKNLHAKWTPIVYHITYDLAGGNFNGAYEYTYTVENRVALPSPIKYMYRFKGWYKDGKPFPKIEEGSIGDIALTAQWVGTVTTIPNGNAGAIMSSTIADDVAIVYFGSATSAAEYHISVANSVNEITLDGQGGTYSMYIGFSNRKNDVVLRLKNIHIKAPVAFNAISINSDDIINVRVEIDSKVTLYGGNGAVPIGYIPSGDYSARIDGRDGGNAIKASNAKIEFVSISGGSLSAFGGNGSAGKDGIPGVNGLKGPDGRNTSQTGGDADNGTDGNNGRQGGSGGYGGNGGDAVVANECNMPNFVFAKGGNGGNGGNGGQGGQGGNGGNGGSDDSNWVNGKPGNGGNGGNGGKGGTGGYGGNGGYGFNVGGTLSGERGDSAEGGAGGAAGQKGEAGCGGSPGSYGSPGAPGIAGQDGGVGEDRSGVKGRS